MNIKIFSAIFILSVLLSCSKSSKPVNTGDPTEDLAWLKTQKTEFAKNCTCIPSIWQATYEGKTIYETGCAGPACNCAHFFYNQDGSVVAGSEEGNRQVFLEKLSDRKAIWSCGK